MPRLPRVLAALVAGTTAFAPVPAPPPLHQGRVFTKADDTRCLTGGAVGALLSVRACDDQTPGQRWYQASTGALYNGLNCIRAEGALVRVAACNGGDPAQDWWFIEEIRSGRYGPCLTDEGDGTVRLQPCTWTLNQKWISSS
ncbi:hypothetical protein ACWT_5906 [Actinoplanes sp. SE50]|uniref:ricin-type beta-trefoil lectin domain protein n=1 Tax=unclassified Actinoplanes TaxID=2626549 RepID=UPI00023EBF9F|nr:MULTISPECIES: ricin-type beta-trefoil lectin domain protein [unclassified Actinoplanes]AEV86925.1 hypothetical protein ACPL_6038 [Actinoplanes sp. SE50/110]ATO85321.1 hypothetical protein ACWT_5906 [Actinoplanes sp. SE50]SLM02732.1 hypothetical protein ACSP50_6017 [Actinoplanes sp. SE50/110]